MRKRPQHVPQRRAITLSSASRLYPHRLRGRARTTIWACDASPVHTVSDATLSPTPVVVGLISPRTPLTPRPRTPVPPAVPASLPAPSAHNGGSASLCSGSGGACSLLALIIAFRVPHPALCQFPVLVPTPTQPSPTFRACHFACACAFRFLSSDTSPSCVLLFVHPISVFLRFIAISHNITPRNRAASNSSH